MLEALASQRFSRRPRWGIFHSVCSRSNYLLKVSLSQSFHWFVLKISFRFHRLILEALWSSRIFPLILNLLTFWSMGWKIQLVSFIQKTFLRYGSQSIVLLSSNRPCQKSHLSKVCTSSYGHTFHSLDGDYIPCLSSWQLAYAILS